MSALMVLLMLAGCQSGNRGAIENKRAGVASRETTQSSDPETIEITDMKGRKVTLPTDVQRVVVTFMEEYFGFPAIKGSINWSDGAISIGKVAGRMLMMRSPQFIHSWLIFRMWAITLTSALNRSSLSDVVLASATVNYDALEPGFENLKEAGIECVFFDFHAQTVEKHTRASGFWERSSVSRAGKRDCRFYTDQMSVISDP